jgi:hypothetical protein
MAPELNDGEGVAFLVREVAPKLKEALGPAYEDGLPKESSGGGVDKMHGEGPFYSCVSRRSNMGLRKKRRGEVTAQLGVAAGRAYACAAQSTARAATAP